MNYMDAMSLLDDLIDNVDVPDHTYNTIAMALKNANDTQNHIKEEFAKCVTTTVAFRKNRNDIVGITVVNTPSNVTLVSHVQEGSIVDMAGVRAGDYIAEINNMQPLSTERLISILKLSDGIVTLKTWRIEYDENIEEGPSSTSSNIPSTTISRTRPTALQYARRAYSRAVGNLANSTTVP
ncbi:hypothetical protein EhV244 [Emiliania huxleyi virus 86]|uniref:PDZ domain-containing protein n=1 Tax=Emiliania huxleyi virus 86 (isolate United Kingdom/English Channel/1999) TaxID=654925 RepID=Q4A2N8_EHV8U|nr:hypothetical protein EhV244 [Emiliania huxleyi virus 86]AHA54850.1 hypothetical protein EhV145_00300 [Emiliania huxleyi virus 145]AHA55870.1 hypothetical protein EhV164_00283 [Emiliania huxleyi virus 164]CAI65668.1 hypothetical protein EhV244 [Emiliania huxleyi virus 86]